jgi:WD40 repeat protein
MPAANQTAGDRLKVFVSYASENLKIAIQIQKVLEFNGFDVLIDREMREPKWKPAIAELVLKSHAFIYLLSPHSARSEHCRWEYERAEEHKKHVIPLWCVPVDKRELPPGLDSWSNIFLYEDDSRPDPAWGDGTIRLIKALSDEREWRKEHTYLEERAVRWDTHGRTEDRLLHGSELVAALQLREANPSGLTLLQHVYLDSSKEAQERSLAERLKDVEAREKADRARTTSRRTIWVAVLGLLVVVAGVAVEEVLNASRQTTLKEEAEGNLRKYHIADSHYRAEQARRIVTDDAVTAVLVALEGLPDENAGDERQRTRPFVNETWHELYSARLRQRERTIFGDHTHTVASAVYSPDGKYVLTASLDNTARLWKSDGTPAATLRHDAAVLGAVFSPDGDRILTASRDGTARQWKLDGAPIAVLQGHTGAVLTAVFSRDGNRILTASRDRTARLWQSDGKAIAVLRGHAGAVLSAVFSPDGRRILTASQDGTAGLWDSGGNEIILRGHTLAVQSAVFSPDGSRILTASIDGTARLWDADGTPGPVLKGYTAVFSRDGDRILTASNDGTARLWDGNGNLLATLRGHAGAIWCAVFLPDGRILTASNDRTARLWDGDGNWLATFQGHTEALASAVSSPDGRYILTASLDSTARLWNASAPPTLQGDTGLVQDAVFSPFSPDGRRILTTSEDGKARLWNDDGTPVLDGDGTPAVLDGHAGAVRIAVFSPDRQRILTVFSGKTAHLWDGDGRSIRSLDGHADTIRSAVFSGDRRILTASADGTARLWDRDGNLIATLQDHTGALTSAIFSPDNGRILTTSEDKTARLWNGDGRLIATLRGHARTVAGAVFLANGRILTASWDGTVRLWNSGGATDSIVTLDEHSDGLRSTAFTRDGSRILATYDDGKVRLWETNGKPIKTFSPLRIDDDGRAHVLVKAVFAPGGDGILTLDDDGKVQMWDSVGELLATLQGSGGTARTRSAPVAVFSPDGHRILTASGDSPVRLWDAFPKPQELVYRAKEEVPRCLTQEQRAALFLPRDPLRRYKPPRWCYTMHKWLGPDAQAAPGIAP